MHRRRRRRFTGTVTGDVTSGQGSTSWSAVLRRTTAFCSFASRMKMNCSSVYLSCVCRNASQSDHTAPTAFNTPTTKTSRKITLLHFTGPPVPITARVHSAPQRKRVGR
eukprot:9504079-Pyramimonas_sp.AAC.3